MGTAQSMLRRVQKLEAARAAPQSPIVRQYGSLEAFGEGVEGLDPVDWPLVLGSLRRWEKDGTWRTWQRMSNAAWEHGV